MSYFPLRKTVILVTLDESNEYSSFKKKNTSKSKGGGGGIGLFPVKENNHTGNSEGE